MLGVTLRWASISSRGRVEILKSSGLMGHLPCMLTYTMTTHGPRDERTCLMSSAIRSSLTCEMKNFWQPFRKF